MSQQFKDLFGKARMDVSRSLKRADLNKSTNLSESKQEALFESIRDGLRSDKADGISTTSLEAYANDAMPAAFKDVKATLRSILIKTEVNEAIGCHPDFDDIKDTDSLRNGYAVTMFLISLAQQNG